MVIKEFYRTREDGVNLYRNYSDSNVRIQCEQTEAIYDEAIDVENAPYTYIETDEPVQSEELTDTQALNVIMGRGLLPNEPINSNAVPEEN